MKIEMEFLRSKVARRVFLLFVISALVPLSLLSALSFAQLDSLLTEQRYESIRQSNKGYGMALLDRLQLLETQLRWISRRILASRSGDAPSLDPPSGVATLNGFTRIHVLRASRLKQTSDTELEHVREIVATANGYLASNKSLLLSLHASKRDARPYLLRVIDPGAADPVYILGEIDRRFLFGDDGAFSREMQVCVLDEQAAPLFCSQTEQPAMTGEPARLEHSTTGHFDWRDANGRDFLISYWSLFLKPRYWAEKWTIVSSIEQSTALVAIASFKLIFAIVVALTLAIISLLSVHQIRRSLIPLERIMDGVHRITAGDFSRAVEVTSGDELEELAGSVNQMATTLEKQFQTLSTLAEIDRLILSSLKAEDIVRVVLHRTQDVLRHDAISMTIVGKDRRCQCHTLIHSAQAREVTFSETQRIPATEIASLKSFPHRLTDLGLVSSVPSYLEPLSTRGASQVLTLPILVKDELSALISLGFEQTGQLVEADIQLARDYANRVAVALANASWEKQLYYLAHFDALTGLPNRLLLKDRLHQALATAERQGSFVAVLFIDLDRFKNVNDSLGHATGDYLLREVAARLSGALREEDTVSRLGGDEFVVLIQQFRNVHDALAVTSTIAQKILETVAHPFWINDREIVTTTSIGIACYPTDGETSSELLKNADAAMYHAKASGKDNYQFYSKILNAEAVERLDMENALRRAVAEEQLELNYQPKVDATSGRICGGEALLRWTHPQRGRISPAKFIPLCEEIGLIIPIGEWVIREVCRQIRRWIDQGLQPVPIAVNLSPVQFRQPDLIAMILKITGETGIAADLLELEITEGAAMENTAVSINTLGQLKELGFHLSIDDFGTGHSSLSYLKQFPIDTLKIDQSFVRHIRESDKDEAIVRSIITLAHSLHCTVVAEGVETLEQFDYLRAVSCDVIQGYFFSPPVPAKDFTNELHDHQAPSRIEPRARETEPPARGWPNAPRSEARHAHNASPFPDTRLTSPLVPIAD